MNRIIPSPDADPSSLPQTTISLSNKTRSMPTRTGKWISFLFKLVILISRCVNSKGLPAHLSSQRRKCPIGQECVLQSRIVPMKKGVNGDRSTPRGYGVLLEESIQTGARKARHRACLFDIAPGMGHQFFQVLPFRLCDGGLPPVLEGRKGSS